MSMSWTVFFVGFGQEIAFNDLPSSQGQGETQSRGLVARRSLYSCYTLYFRRWRYYEDCGQKRERGKKAALAYIGIIVPSW